MTAEHEDLTRASATTPIDQTLDNQTNSEISTDRSVEPKPHVIHGGRNLMILGIGATVIALISTTVSLWIYRGTGDIYLDRSRPGYIAKDEKRDDDEEGDEDFSSEGEITQDVLDSYLEEIDSISGRIRARENSFATDQLSDDALGIYVRTDESSTKANNAEDSNNSSASESSSENF